MNILSVNDKTCFDLALQEPAGWSSFKFEDVTYRVDSALPKLTISDDSNSYNGTFGWYKIIGMVRNDNATKVTYVMPVGTLYNGSNKVVGCDFTFVNSTDLIPGQSSAFDMTFMGRDYNDVATYRLQVDGHQ